MNNKGQIPVLQNYSSTLVRVAQAMVVATLLSACGSDDDGGFPANDLPLVPNRVTITSVLSSAEQVPALAVEGASGVSTLTLDTASGALSGSVKVSDLSGLATHADIYQGFAGNTGNTRDPIVTLDSNTDRDEWFIPAGEVLDTPQLAAMLAGEYYVNVHTEQNPAGEIRAQIVLGAVQVIRSTLSGENEVPPVQSNASADAVTTLNTITGAINTVIVTTGLLDASSVQIHAAPAGENGEMVLALQPDANDSTTWRTAAGAVLDPASLTAFAAGALYYNIQTAAYGAGEIRGQMAAEPGAGIGTAFTLTIENVSTDTTLEVTAGSEAVPLSPVAYIVHRQDQSPLLAPLSAANPALESLAEDGDPTMFPEQVAGSKVVNIPSDSATVGPIFSENKYVINFTASPGDKLSLVTMFVESNDWFYTTSDEDNSIDLFNTTGTPLVGDVSSKIALWESGTEVDEVPGEGPNQPARQAAPNTGEIEATGVGSLLSKGVMPLLNGDVIKVTLGLQ